MDYDSLNTKTIVELKQICRTNNYKGFSLWKRKKDLILFIISNDTKSHIHISEATSNQKRINTCKNIGEIKRSAGYLKETMFQLDFNITSPISYKAEADTSFDKNYYLYEYLISSSIISSSLDTYNVSIKSGKNIQFVLGCIPELLHNPLTILSNHKKCELLFSKYLGKSTSAKSCHVLAYFDDNNDQWIFFNMNEVVQYISSNCHWRLLGTGRIKGDFDDYSSKGRRQYITYEYRTTHKSHFLGCNGNRGHLFIELLKNNIKSITYTRKHNE